MNPEFRIGTKCPYNVYRVTSDNSNGRFAVTFEFEDGAVVRDALNHWFLCPYGATAEGS